MRHKAGPVEDRHVGTGQEPARQGCPSHGRARSSKAKSSKAGRVAVRQDMARSTRQGRATAARQDREHKGG